MTRFVGCDVHKRQVTVCILDEAGSVVERHRIGCTREGLLDFCGTHLEATDQIALEATTHTWAVVELIEPFVERIVVSNPLATRAIAWAKVKTDAIDARTLAQLLRVGLLPEVWRPDARTLRLRQLTHRRAVLVADQTALKNRIHATLAMRLIEVPVRNLWGTQGLQWLGEVEVDPDGREALDADLRLLVALEAELAGLEKRLAEIAWQSDATRLLMTLPGVGVAVAQGLLAAWGDVGRFPDADRAVAYLGLVPSTRQSDQACYHGRITKRGNSHARWLLVQAAQHVDDHPGPLGVFFRRLAKKKNRNVAVVATARKMALIAYHMLRNGEPYRYAVPLPTQDRLARLRVQATGRRRRGGVPKGTPRSKTRYATGKPMRKVPALPDVYQSEDLPKARTPDSVSPAEQRHLRSTRTLGFAKTIQKTHQKPRSSKGKNQEPADDQLTSS